MRPRTNGSPLALQAVVPRCEACGRATVAITVRLAENCYATLRSCDECGSAWDINGAAAPRHSVHALVPRSESPIAIWRKGGEVRPLRHRAPKPARMPAVEAPATSLLHSMTPPLTSSCAPTGNDCTA
jgi:hypothetical protein